MSTDGQISQTGSIQTMECYAALKRKGILTPARVRHLEATVLGTIGPRQTPTGRSSYKGP